MDNNAPTPAPRPQAAPRNDGFLGEGRFGKVFLLIVFILSLALFVSVVRIFIVDIVLAAVFATLFHPVFKKLLKLSGNRRGISAFASCVLMLVGLLIPLFIISNIVVVQAVDLYHSAAPRVKEILQKGDAGVLGALRNTPLGNWLSALSVDWPGLAQETARSLGPTLAKVINKTSRATLTVIVNLFIILFSVFYFLRDGETMLHRARPLIPLSEAHKDLIIDRFASISLATVKGTLFVALIQSFLGTLTLWSFGVDAWMVWGVVMLVFAVIPFVGPGAVLIPAGVIKIITGSTWQGVAIILISVGIVSTIDNVLRPRIVGAHAGMHDLLVFFSTLGGIFMFGPAGFIIGPLIAATFLTMLDIFSAEFQDHIDYHKKAAAKKEQ